jgi:hypothetical protein
MAQSNTPMILPKTAQEGILTFSKQCYGMLNQQWNIREQMRAVDLAYIRENDYAQEHTRAKVANKYGDPSRYQDIVVPVVMPAVESATMYQTSVFLQGNPIFGVVSDSANEDAALQMESVIDENSVRGGWSRELMLFFRDGFKYNLAFVEVVWERQVTAVLETNLAFSATQGKPKETTWEGNRVVRWDPYNTFFDSRVAPAEIYKKGEFIGRTELMSRIQLKQFIQELPDKMVDNIKAAFESGLGSSSSGSTTGIESFYIPQINPEAMLNRNPRASTDWMAWAGMQSGSGTGAKIAYKNIYEVTTLYGKIIPSDFNLRVPSQNTPQIWKFVIVNHQVIIYAERQTNAHGYLPVLAAQPLEDGLNYQAKSLAQNVKPIQELSTALMTASVAARRRAISDRGLYDPSRVTEANINSDNPSAKIPVRPAAYGKPLNEAYYPIPFRDDQSPIIMQELAQLQNFSNTITGRNPAQQGQFVKGNKTLHEYQDVMAHANGRDQMISILLEAQVFTPMKEILKLNIFQFQQSGDVYNRSKSASVSIDPNALRAATLAFKVSDGLLPSDKLIGADALQTALQVIGSSPQISSGYNIGPLFSYLMKTQGAHISEFEKSPAQQAYEQAVQQWQQTVMGMMKENPAVTSAQFPPQPTPQQYGYTPGGTVAQNQGQQQGPGVGMPVEGQPQVNVKVRSL